MIKARIIELGDGTVKLTPCTLENSRRVAIALEPGFEPHPVGEYTNDPDGIYAFAETDTLIVFNSRACAELLIKQIKECIDLMPAKEGE